MAVITISRESGARGSYIGRKLADRLGYDYLDGEVIHEVCLEYGVQAGRVRAVSMSTRRACWNDTPSQPRDRAVDRSDFRGSGPPRQCHYCRSRRIHRARDYGDVLNVRVAATA